MKDFEIRCDESHLEKNHTLYGKFTLGPFLPGQGTTFGNALRRSLLSELSGLGITAFEILGVMQEFSTLPGLRESILDLSLNLKQVILTGILPCSTPPIGFLKVRGPAIIYAADLQLPAGVYCTSPEQYIATLTSDGVLNMKFLVSVGKGHSTQPYSLYRSLSKIKLQPTLSPNYVNKVGAEQDIPLFDDEWKNSLDSINDIQKMSQMEVENPEMQSFLESKIAFASKKNFQENFDKSKPLHSVKSEMSFLSPSLEVKPFFGETLLRTGSKASKEGDKKETEASLSLKVKEVASKSGDKEYAKPFNYPSASQALYPEGVLGTGSEIVKSATRYEDNVGSLKNYRSKIVGDDFTNSEQGFPGYVNIQKQTFQRVNPHQVLPIDAVFTPVSQVNFLTQINDRFETVRENVVLEIWTNGSIHPKRALEEAALSLVQNFDTLLKSIQQASSFYKGLRYFHYLQGTEGTPYKKKDGSKNYSQRLNLPLDQKQKQKRAVYNLDIGNLDISLETFILLKQAKVKTLANLLHYLKENNSDLVNFLNTSNGKKVIDELNKVVNQLGIN